MNDQRPKRETKTIDEATISNMWEIAALGVLFHHYKISRRLSSAGTRSCG
jgi:hypothetical protein